MRVGIIALQHESNTFVSGATTLDDFRRDHVLTGEAIRPFMADAHHEVGGFLEQLDTESIQPVPIFSARALPGPPLQAAAFDHLIDTMERAFRQAGPLDGLLLAPHGACVTEHHADADGHWLALIRAWAPTLPIVATIDPHANLSPRMIDACDAMIAYRTNPHVDSRDRGREAARLLAAELRNQVQLRQSACFPPMTMNIERQSTAEPHWARVHDTAESLRSRPGVLSVSLVMGFPYADVAEMGTAVIVVTDGRTLAPDVSADEFGTVLWQERARFRGELLDVDVAMSRIADEPEPVLLLDMGDNVGGGGPGDGTIIAHAMHDRGVGRSILTICDPESVALCDQAGAGTRLRLSIGGKTDARHGAPLPVQVEVLALHDGRFHESQARHGGWADFDMGRIAVVRTDRDMTVMLTSSRLFPVSARQWTAFGIDISDYRVIVAKGVHAPVTAYQEICKRFVRVNTPGVTTADMTALTYLRRRRPLYPFEEDFDWSLAAEGQSTP